MTRAAAVRRLAFLAGLAACASAPERPAGPFVGAGFAASHLATERVAVLPVGEMRLPPGGANPDSLEAALAGYAGDVLAQALARRGVAGRVPGPGVLAPALEAAGFLTDRVTAGLLRAPPESETGGALGNAEAEDVQALSEIVGAGFFLIPLTLGYEAVAPLRFRALLDLALVDAGAGRVVWRARAAAENPVPPPGDAADLFAAALEDATVAVADRAARRLAAVGE